MMHNVDLRRLLQRLVNHAIPFCETEQRSELLFARVAVQIEVQLDPLEPDGYIFGYAESAAEVEIAFRANDGVP